MNQMNQMIPQRIIDEYVKNMGLDENIVKMAWQQMKNESEFMETYFKLQQQNNQLQVSPQGKQQDEDQLLNQVILDSLKQNQGTQISFETMNPEQRKRRDQVPTGLKNVGNTCYFNSLLQTYFYNCEFVRTILKFKPPQMIDENNPKLNSSLKLMQNLQSLFVSMIGSDKKYVDPTEVVKSICDDFGNVLPIGDQKDVGEFNHYFLSRIDEALSLNQHVQSKIYDHEEIAQDNQLNQSSQSSIFRQKSGVISSESLISKLFFGKVTHQLNFQQYGKLVIRENYDLFNFIPLNVKISNFYDSWEDFMISEIDDFRNDQEESVKASKFNWIKESPQTLSFQLQRVQYCKERNDLIKLNDQFQFPEEICIDRFLIQNSKQYMEIRNKNKELKEKQKQIKQDLLKINEFNNLVNFPEALNSVIQFLDLQISSQTNNPVYFGNKGDVKSTLSCLNSYQLKIKKLIEEKQKKYQDLENQIQASLNNLKSQKYVLQSILIQDGLANSGHYYAYIFDGPNKKWFKFNDIHVEEVPKEQVFQDAYGGKGVVNAYLLVYVREETFKKELNLMNPLRTYRISQFKSEYLTDVYGAMLSDPQREHIMKENQMFQTEIEDYKHARLVDQIADGYSRKFEFINEQLRLLIAKHNNLKFKPSFTLNFPLFVKSKQNISYDNLVKWSILDSCVRDVHPEKIGVLDNQLTENLKMKILNKFKSTFNEYKAPNLSFCKLLEQSIASYEQQYLTNLTQEYLSNIHWGSQCFFVLEKFINEDFILTLQSLQYFTKNVKLSDQKAYFYKQALNFKIIVPIVILCSYISKEAKIDIEVLDLLVAFLQLKHFEYDEPKFWSIQISLLLSVICENHPQIIDLTRITKNFDNNYKNQEASYKLDQYPIELINTISAMAQHHEVHFWNTNNTHDILFERIVSAWNILRDKYKNFILIQTKIKDSLVPLMPEQIIAILKLDK